MKALMLTLIAGITVYGGAQLAETVAPQASEATAVIQGRLVSDRAYLDSEMGSDWESALKSAVEQARHNDGQLTVTGTTVRWENGVDVWCIALPEPTSLVKPERCS